jgi:uncharacterized damage-inducible protein DinB
MSPYEASLGSRDVMSALAETPDRIRELVGRMSSADFTRPLAPGKWNVRQLLIHLAHTEMAFGMRARLALTTDHYVVQPFDQDSWLEREPLVDAPAALAAYYAMRRWNLPFFRGLSAEDRARTFLHPERGQMTVNSLLEILAGHELHHAAQLEQIAGHARA